MGLSIFWLFLMVTSLQQASLHRDSVKFYLESDPGRVSVTADAFLDDQTITKDSLAEWMLLKAAALINLSEFRSAMAWLDSAERVALGDDVRMQGEILHRRGVALEYLNEYPASRNNFFEALKRYRAVGDSTLVGDVYRSIGNSYTYDYDYPRSLIYHLKAVELATQVKDEDLLADSYLNIGYVHDYQHNFQEAVRYYSKAAEIYEHRGNLFDLAACYNNLGIVSKNQGNLDDALIYYRKALGLFKKLGHQWGISALFTNVGNVQLLAGDYENARQNHKEALGINLKIENKDGVANSYINLGFCFLRTGELANALEHFKKGSRLAEEAGADERRFEGYQGLSETYEAMNNPGEALRHYKLYKALEDSVFSREKSEKILELQSKYESRLQAQEIELLKLQNDAQLLDIQQRDLKLSQRNFQLISSFVLLILVLLSGYLAFNKFRLKKQHEQELVVIASEQNQRHRISKDLHDDIGSGLTKIALSADLLNLTLSKEQQMEAATIVKKLAAHSRDLQDNLRNIVWALNPAEDSLQSFFTMLHTYVSELFEHSRITPEVMIDIPETDFKLSPQVRHHMYLVYKELLNNVVKHSRATNVSVTVSATQTRIIMDVADDGVGFCLEKSLDKGNGLGNLKRRIAELEGHISWTSNDQGTSVHVEAPFA